MHRSFVLLLTLFALLWHGIASASLGVGLDAADGAAHAVLHWTETGHHHDDHGGYELDDSAASTAHIAMDGSAPTILDIGPLVVPNVRGMSVQPSYAQPTLAAPCLAPIQKPPRF